MVWLRLVSCNKSIELNRTKHGTSHVTPAIMLCNVYICHMIFWFCHYIHEINGRSVVDIYSWAPDTTAVIGESSLATIASKWLDRRRRLPLTAHWSFHNAIDCHGSRGFMKALRSAILVLVKLKIIFHYHDERCKK